MQIYKSTCPLVTKLFELNKHLTCSQWCRTTQSAVVCRESFSVWITPWTEPAGWYHLPRSNLQKETRGPFRTRKTGIHTLTGHKQEVQYCPGAYLLCTCKPRMKRNSELKLHWSTEKVGCMHGQSLADTWWVWDRKTEKKLLSMQ